jgi:hypothetical protein
MTTIKIMFQNVQARADVEGRWPGHVEVVKEEDPDLLILTEVEWLADEVKRKRVEIALGMHLMVGPTRNLNTAVAWRRDGVLEFEDCDVTYAHELHHGYTAPRFKVNVTIDGKPKELTLVAIGTHLSPYSVLTAAQEASLLCARVYRCGGLGLICGDINHCPVFIDGESQPPWEQVQPYNRASRCLRRTSESDAWVGNELVGQTLRDGGLTDVAAHMAMRTGDMTLLHPTGKAGLVRVDQAHVTAALTRTITEYHRVDNPHSDHYGGAFTLRLDRADLSLLREYT